MRTREDTISITSSKFQTGYPHGDPCAFLVTITFNRKHLIFANKTSCISKQTAYKALNKHTNSKN